MPFLPLGGQPTRIGETHEERVESSGGDPGDSRQVIAITPLAASLKQVAQDEHERL